MDSEQLAARGALLLAAGLAASDDGRPEAAARTLSSGVRLLERSPTGDRPELVHLRGRLLVSLAWAESERGRVDAGFRLLDRAEPLLAPRNRALLRAQRGLMLSRAGRDEPALVEYDAAVVALEALGPPLDLVKALNNRSLVHLEAGRIAAARADLRRCSQIASQHDLRLHVALSEVNLGCLDVLAGDLPAALGAFTRARATYDVLAPGRLPSLAVERARALSAAGLFSDADRELAYAVEHADDQHLSFTLADALLARSEAALLAGRLDDAATWAIQARARFRGRGNARRAALAALLELRATQTPDGDPAARALVVRARSLAVRLDRLGLPEDARVARLLAARMLLSAGRPAAAAAVVRDAGPGRLDRLDTRLLRRLTRAELAAATGRPDLAARERTAGMATLRRYRSRFGSLDLQTGASAHGQDLARAGLDAALAGGSTGAVFRWAERARAQALLVPPARGPDDPGRAAVLAELRQARQSLRTAELAGRAAPGLAGRVVALERTLREGSWSVPGSRDGHAGSGGSVASVGAVREVLGGAALVSYLRDGGLLRALILTERSLRLLDVGPYDAAAEAATRLRADLDTQAGRVLPARLADALADAVRHDADVLAATVLDPIAGLVGDRPLVVVPTGALFTAPWGALATGRAWSITVTPSATTWQAGRRRLASRQRGGPARALLVAGPGTARGVAEVTEIGRVHDRATTLTGSAATTTATLAGLGSVELAHIAAHGQHRIENPLFSSLDLADGPLFGYDLGSVSTPPMVVLSCCDLALSDVRPGDETLGLAAALLSSGTTTVVASVARVADDLAMQVMTDFHARVAAGLDAATALAQAAYGGQPANGFICFGAA